VEFPNLLAWEDPGVFPKQRDWRRNTRLRRQRTRRCSLHRHVGPGEQHCF